MNAIDISAKQAERAAIESLAQAKATLERSLRELDRHLEQLESAQTPTGTTEITAGSSKG